MQAVETTKKDLHFSLHSPTPRHNRYITSFQIYFLVRENTRDCQPLQMVKIVKLEPILKIFKVVKTIKIAKVVKIIKIAKIVSLGSWRRES